MTRTAESTQHDHICATAVDHFGRFGFDESMLEMSIATNEDVETLSELFGSIEGLRVACDEYVQSAIRAAKAEALSARDPGTWFAEVAHVESFAPLMSYFVRSLQAGDELARSLMGELIADVEASLESAVRKGTVKPSRDPAARARFLVLNGGGGFLLYRQMHASPEDMVAVLKDYAADMMIPAVDVYTQGLMADDTMYEALLAAAQRSTRS